MSYRDWHVGMKVVCINQSWVGDTEGVVFFPQYGEVYTIRTICADIEDVFIRLMEITNPVQAQFGHEFEAEYIAGNFRPVQHRKSDISIFTRMLDPKHQKVDA